MKTAEPLPQPARSAEVWPVSVEAYHVLGEAGLIPDRTELLYGVVYHKMAKSPTHSFLVQVLQQLLQRFLPQGFLVRIEQPITCLDSEPEPDLAVVRGTISDFRRAHPRTAELLIEVCVTSADYDRSKLKAYARAGVKECWLVLEPERRIEVYRQPSGDQFNERIIHDSSVGTFASHVFPGLEIDVTSLFG